MNASPRKDAFDRTAEQFANESVIDIPRLVTYAAAASNANVLASSAKASFSAKNSPASEIIMMPKLNFGSRPLAILSPVDRIVYSSLIDALDGALPRPSREKSFAEHRAFGTGGNRSDREHVVLTDVAACFEYIDHNILQEELLVQSMDHEATENLINFLGRLSLRPIGIPQGILASHRLADLYLSRIDRMLDRNEHEYSRFVDDISVLAESPHHAFEILESIEFQARKLGLTLASTKTKIASSAELATELAERSAILDEYYKSAADSLRSLKVIPSGYDDFDIEEIEGTREEIDFSALNSILDDWLSGEGAQRAALRQLAPMALRGLTKAPERINTEKLRRISESSLHMARDVIAYATLRENEVQDNIDIFASIFQIPRMSDWGNLWLLWGAATLHDRDKQGGSYDFPWVSELLESNSETVRGEAAWVASLSGRLDLNIASDLFTVASPVSLAGVAAAIGHADGSKKSKLGKAVSAESPIARSAYSWGAVN